MPPQHPRQLFLRRKVGEPVDLFNQANGQTVRVIIEAIYENDRGQAEVRLGFDDPDHLYRIERPDRKPKPDRMGIITKGYTDAGE